MSRFLVRPCCFFGEKGRLSDNPLPYLILGTTENGMS